MNRYENNRDKPSPCRNNDRSIVGQFAERSELLIKTAKFFFLHSCDNTRDYENSPSTIRKNRLYFRGSRRERAEDNYRLFVSLSPRRRSSRIYLIEIPREIVTTPDGHLISKRRGVIDYIARIMCRTYRKPQADGREETGTRGYSGSAARETS